MEKNTYKIVEITATTTKKGRDRVVCEEGEKPAILAARALRDEAYKRGGTGEISVIVIKLSRSGP